MFRRLTLTWLELPTMRQCITVGSGRSTLGLLQVETLFRGPCSSSCSCITWNLPLRLTRNRDRFHRESNIQTADLTGQYSNGLSTRLHLLVEELGHNLTK